MKHAELYEWQLCLFCRNSDFRSCRFCVSLSMGTDVCWIPVLTVNIKEPPLHTCACLHTYKPRARAQHTARVIRKASIRSTQLPQFSRRGHRVQAHQHFFKCWNDGGQIKQEKHMKQTQKKGRGYISEQNISMLLTVVHSTTKYSHFDELIQYKFLNPKIYAVFSWCVNKS